MGQLKCTVAFAALVFCVGCDREVLTEAQYFDVRVDLDSSSSPTDTTAGDTNAPDANNPDTSAPDANNPDTNVPDTSAPDVKDGTVTVTVKLDLSCFKTPKSQVELVSSAFTKSDGTWEAPKAMILSNKVAQYTFVNLKPGDQLQWKFVVDGVTEQLTPGMFATKTFEGYTNRSITVPKDHIMLMPVAFMQGKGCSQMTVEKKAAYQKTPQSQHVELIDPVVPVHFEIQDCSGLVSAVTVWQFLSAKDPESKKVKAIDLVAAPNNPGWFTGTWYVSTASKKVFFRFGSPSGKLESSVDIAKEGCVSDSNKTMRMLNPNVEQLVMASLQHCAPCGMKAVSSNAYRGMVIVDMSQEITATNMGFDPSKHVVELINASNNGVVKCSNSKAAFLQDYRYKSHEWVCTFLAPKQPSVYSLHYSPTGQTQVNQEPAVTYCYSADKAVSKAECDKPYKGLPSPGPCCFNKACAVPKPGDKDVAPCAPCEGMNNLGKRKWDLNKHYFGVRRVTFSRCKPWVP